MQRSHTNPHRDCEACRQTAGHEQVDLLSWSPPAPSDPSPTPEKFKRAKGDPRDYAREWRAFVEAHPEAASLIVTEALLALAMGARRVSVNVFFEAVRARLKVSANNSHRAAAADWLIAREPRLADVIERRRRKVTK